METRDFREMNALLAPPKGSERERDNLYYSILAGGARMRLLEAFLDLGISELLGQNIGKPLSAKEICERLNLHPVRGWKFLHILSMMDLLTEINAERGDDSALYTLSNQAVSFFGNRGNPDDSYFFRELVAYWRYISDMPVSLAAVVKGAELPRAVPVWPPATPESAQLLERWMTVTAEGAISTIMASNVMDNARDIMDVGGGDGSIAIAIVKSCFATNKPIPNITVFNLPASAKLAEENIANHGLQEYIKVVVGNFLTDTLPCGFDRVMYSRVLTDWTPKVCKMLLEKAKVSLRKGGKIVINECFNEGNIDYATAWEFRYLYYDTFGKYLFKPSRIYKEIFEDIGCKVVSQSPMLPNAFYSVLVAEVADI